MSKTSTTRCIYLGVWRQVPPAQRTPQGKSAVSLAYFYKLDSLGSMANWFYSDTIKENIRFVTRTSVSTQQPGTRRTIQLSEDLPFHVHTYIMTNGLAGVLVAEKGYPLRAAFNVIFECLTITQDKLQGKWANIHDDQSIEPPFIRDLLNVAQDPRNDKLTKINQDLDNIKHTLLESIELCVDNQNSFDDLLKKSEDLSESSKELYDKSNSMNSCWRRWGCEIM